MLPSGSELQTSPGIVSMASLSHCSLSMSAIKSAGSGGETAVVRVAFIRDANLREEWGKCQNATLASCTVESIIRISRNTSKLCIRSGNECAKDACPMESPPAIGQWEVTRLLRRD